MLNVISGRFHPSLETRLITHLREIKQDPFSPVLLVGATSRLNAHLERILSRSELPTFQIHLLTLSGLVENTALAEGPLPKPLLSDPLFYDTLVKMLLKEGKSFPQMDDLALPHGFPPAVRATLRDLVDAGVNETNVEEAIKENFIGKSVDLGSLRSLLHLYRLYLKKIQSLPIYPRSALIQKATEVAPTSSYLSSFKAILFYGFYDMTGTQFDFFEALSKHHPTTLYFPYVRENTAFTFSQHFRDHFLQQIPHTSDFLSEKLGATSNPETEILSVSGFTDEAMTVARQMVQLHDEKKIPYSQMAVVARRSDRLTEAFPSVLQHFKIPFSSTAKTYYRQNPLAQAAFQLLELADHKPLHPSELDFLKHPTIKVDLSSSSFTSPEIWPDKETWFNYIQRTKSLLEPYFDLPPELEQALDSLGNFATLAAHVSRREYLDLLKEKWDQVELPSRTKAYGVSLLHAEAARGLSFDVVFLIGLEEKIFPRLIREDPFLRDDARYALNATLGHKITQKLSALEEERLLFHLFLDAARVKRVLMFRRSDEEGNVVGSSSFLRAFVQDQGQEWTKSISSVPRPLLSKLNIGSPSTLPLSLVKAFYLTSGNEPSAIELTDFVQKNKNRLAIQLKIRDALHSFDAPSAYDGLIGKNEDRVVFRDGQISATALENFGRCGFKYWGENIIGLKTKGEHGVQDTLEAHIKGTAVHHFLESFYTQLSVTSNKNLPTHFPTILFDDVYQKTISSLTSDQLQVHPLIWEAEKIKLKRRLEHFLQRDLAECLSSQLVPTFIEKEFVGPLSSIDNSSVFRGWLDRVDKGDKQIRVVDYKTGTFYEKRNIVLDSVRAQKLQGPLYLLMMEQHFLSSRPTDFQFDYLYPLEEEESRLSLSSSEWTTHKARLVETIRTLLSWIRLGHFIMVPEESKCSWCDMAQICRKNHTISAYRTRQGEGKKFLELLEQS